MRRASLERAWTLRVWRQHVALIHDSGPIHCICELQFNRFRKRQRIAGCGKARCWGCKHDKLLGCPTRQSVRANLTYREWLSELNFRPVHEEIVRRNQSTTAWTFHNRRAQ